MANKKWVWQGTRVAKAQRKMIALVPLSIRVAWKENNKRAFGGSVFFLGKIRDRCLPSSGFLLRGRPFSSDKDLGYLVHILTNV